MRNVRPLLLCAAFLAGCTSVPTRVDEGRIDAATFSWMPSRESAAASSADAKAVDAAVLSAVEDALAQKGVRRVDGGGDITVGYLVVLHSAAATTTSAARFGYGPEAMQIQTHAHRRAEDLYSRIEKDRTQDASKVYVAALVIDVVDAKSLRLLYRNFAYRPVQKNPTEEQRQSRVREAVDEILRGLDRTGRPTP
jgi:hypothetical protein